MSSDLGALSFAAVTLGFVHCLCGPDHYIPFVAMSRIGLWSLRKTILVTILCGIGHVASSAVLGFIGIALGIIVLQLETAEQVRGSVAGWLLTGFGLVYFLAGISYAIYQRGTRPWAKQASTQNDADVEARSGFKSSSTCHGERRGEGSIAALTPHPTSPLEGRGGLETASSVDAAYLAPSEEADAMVDAEEKAAAITARTGNFTPWILFVIFLFGPCEPLIPLLIYPAAKANLWSAVCVTLLFGVTTLVTMTALVCVIYLGTFAIRFRRAQRYGHALAGLVILLCGLAIMIGL